MRFLADAGISPKTVDFLNQLGHEAVHVRTVGLERSPDRALVERAGSSTSCARSTSAGSIAGSPRATAALKAGYATYDWVRRDPDLAALRENPRFVALIGKGGA